MENNSNLKESDGPCIQRLNETLHKIGVDRQAYHGGSFNGNHTHKCLLVRKSLQKILLGLTCNDIVH